MRLPGQNLTDLTAQIQAQREQIIELLPPHLRRLGEVLRLSVDGDSAPLAEFLHEQGWDIPRDQLDSFRDYLIIRRPDLRDLSAEARARLRSSTLADDDPSEITGDYRSAVLAGETPRCRDCRHFVTAPNDGTPNGDKSCVAMGTRGTDVACYGFMGKLRPGSC